MLAIVVTGYLVWRRRNRGAGKFIIQSSLSSLALCFSIVVSAHSCFNYSMTLAILLIFFFYSLEVPWFSLHKGLEEK